MECWRQILGFEGLYDVSDKGRVYSYYSNKIMSPGKTTKGYLTVKLCKNKKHCKKLIHRLVAKAFLQNPEGLPEINHIDEDKYNNKVENLEWVSLAFNVEYSQAGYFVLYDKNDQRIEIFNINKYARNNDLHNNALLRVAQGKINSYYGYTREPGMKLNKKGKFELMSPEGEVFTFEKQTEAADRLGFTHSNISQLLNGKIKSVKGWTLP